MRQRNPFRRWNRRSTSLRRWSSSRSYTHGSRRVLRGGTPDSNPDVCTQLACLVTFICPVHQHRQILSLAAQATKQLAAFDGRDDRHPLQLLLRSPHALRTVVPESRQGPDARHAPHLLQGDRKISDFNPEQQHDPLAVVWLYRGETDQFLALVSRYLKDVMDDTHGNLTEQENPSVSAWGCLGRSTISGVRRAD